MFIEALDTSKCIQPLFGGLCTSKINVWNEGVLDE